MRRRQPNWTWRWTINWGGVGVQFAYVPPPEGVWVITSTAVDQWPDVSVTWTDYEIF